MQPDEESVVDEYLKTVIGLLYNSSTNYIAKMHDMHYNDVGIAKKVRALQREVQHA